MLIVTMGVAGSGKTTVGQQLADACGAAFYDADQYHSPSAVAKMQAGEALTDSDREPWLERLAQLIVEIGHRDPMAVLACSALKTSYRARLRVAADGVGIEIVFVYLRILPEVARARLRQRHGHYMPASLVESQFATLEEPDDAVTLDATAAPEFLVEKIRAIFKNRWKPVNRSSPG